MIMTLLRFIKRGFVQEKLTAEIRKRFPFSSVSLASFHSKIGRDVSLSKGVKIASGVTILGEVHIGKGTIVNGPTKIVASAGTKIHIGSLTSIAGFVSVHSGNHPVNEKISTFQTGSGVYGSIFSNSVGSLKSISIGSDVWIGTQSIVLSGVKVGNGAIIGAGSTVTADVPPYSIVAGNPARIIKYRFSQDIIEWLNEIQWWDWSDDMIFLNKEFFQMDIQKMTLEEIKRYIVDK